MTDILKTSRSGFSSYQECPRLHWWQYKAPSGGVARGWEKKKIGFFVSTGIYTHNGIADLLQGVSVDEAVKKACEAYIAKVSERGLDLELPETLEGQVAEQAALIEGLIRAWNRVRLPHYLEHYDVVEVEKEEFIMLSDAIGDAVPAVGLMARSDAIIRRKSDAKLFICNWKTVGVPDYRWYQQWETDSQLLTETLAVEERLGERLGGVIVEGLIKGRRSPVKDRETQDVIDYRQSSTLIYGYKHPGNPPLEEPAYDFNYTKKKGWGRFKVWTDEKVGGIKGWVDWLPEELVESQFAVVPPIMRNEQTIRSKVTQIVQIELNAHTGMRIYDAASNDEERQLALDMNFPQNERSCIWPNKCWMYSMCWSPGTSEDPLESGLFVPRIPHHPQEVGDE